MKTPKTIRIIIMALIIASFSGCEELMDQFGINFKSDYYAFNFTIDPEEATIGDFKFKEKVYMSDLDSILDENDLDKDNLKSVELHELTLEIVNPNTDINFDMVEHFELYILSGSHPELLVAEVSSVPTGTRVLTFLILDKELKKYLDEDSYTIKLMGELNDIPAEIVEVEGKLRFKFTGGI